MMRKSKKILLYRFIKDCIYGGFIGIGVSLIFFLIFSGYQNDNLWLNLVANLLFGFLIGGLISLCSGLAVLIMRRFTSVKSWEIYIMPIIVFVLGFGLFYSFVSVLNLFFTVMPSEIKMGVSLGVGVVSTMITFFFMIIEQQEERIQLERENKKLAVVEERNRIARELHDSVSQNLFGISLNLSTLPGILERDEAKAKAISRQLQSMVQEVQTEMRLMIYELRPLSLQDKDFFEALENLISLFCRRYQLTISYNLSGKEEKVSSKIQLALYRIIQEALNNVVKHTELAAVKIELKITEQIELTIEDNGQGFDLKRISPAGHFGISGMAERVKKLGGKFLIDSKQGKGTHIEAYFKTTELV